MSTSTSMDKSKAVGGACAAVLAVSATLLLWLRQRNQQDPSGKEKKKEEKGNDAKGERKREKKEMKEAEKKLKKRMKDLQK